MLEQEVIWQLGVKVFGSYVEEFHDVLFSVPQLLEELTAKVVEQVEG